MHNKRCVKESRTFGKASREEKEIRKWAERKKCTVVGVEC